jgi:predicted dehydrogenase
MRTPLSVGVVGLDARGLEYAHALAELPQVSLRWLCDDGGELRQHTARRFATAVVTNDPLDLLEDEALDAIAFTSGCRSDLVWTALSADKHVLAGAPLAHSPRAAAEIVRLAQARGRALVLSEPLVAQPAAGKLKELIETGRLGEVYALHASRQGLPRTRPRDDGVWTFGVDDLSLLLYLLDDEPIEVLARAESYVEPGVVDVAFCYLRFATGISAHLHLSWLDPLRIRRVTAIGSKRMAVLDDLEPERKLTVYQQSAPRARRAGNDPDAGIGDVRSPRIDPDEPVRLECERLVAAARTASPDPAARRAISVLEVLERVHECLERDVGAVVEPLARPVRPDLHIVPLRPA